MPDQPSPRRCFQFRLRTLMIGVTLLAAVCGYVGWQARIMMERAALLRLVVNDGGGYIIARGEGFYSINCPGTYETIEHPDQSPSWIRHWLGDEYVYVIYMPQSVSAPNAAIIVERFPEAVIAHEETAAKSANAL